VNPRAKKLKDRARAEALLLAALKLPAEAKGSFDLTAMDGDDVQAVAEILQQLGFATYVSSGKIAVQRVHKHAKKLKRGRPVAVR
jgi:hypothetical protein